MQRHVCQPRADWRERVEGIGFNYQSHDEGPYWDESACYELTAAEVESLEGAGNVLHRLCLDRPRLGGAVVGVAGACGGETNGTGSPLGGETNWLGDCESNGHCAEGECICGICTAY